MQISNADTKRELRDEGFNIPRGASGEIKTRCPECSDSRRKSREKCVSVNVDEGTWNCHHCGFKGGIVSEEDMAKVTKTGGSTKSKREQSSEPEPIDRSRLKEEIPEDVKKSLEESRGISGEVIDRFDMRWGRMKHSGKDLSAIQFPYFYEDELINIKTRGQGKHFRMVSGADHVPFNIDSIEEDEPVIITEGEFDVLAWHEAQKDADIHIPAISVPNGANRKSNNLSYLENCPEKIQMASKFILAIDDDEAGDQLRQELSRRLKRGKCEVVEYPDGCKDLNDALIKEGSEAVVRSVKTAKPYPIDGILYMKEMSEDIMNLYEEGFDRGVSTGWPTLDNYYRIRETDLSIVTGIPTNGKSTFVDNLVVNVAKAQDWKFAICSPEHWPPSEHGAKLMAKWAQKPFDSRHSNRMSEEEIRNYLSRMNDHIFYITSDERGSISPESILETAEQALFRYGINGLVVDPWNGLSHNTASGEMSSGYISQKLEEFRQFAKINETHVWIIAHPTKQMDDNVVPNMYDIYGSSTWYDKADCGIVVEKERDGQTAIHVKKIKHSEVGEEGIAKLEFIPGSEHLEDANYAQR